MSADPVFLDVNIPMYAAGGEHPLRDSCVWIMTAVAAGELPAVIDVEIIQEILYRFGAAGRWPLAISMAENILKIVPVVLPVTTKDMKLTVDLTRTYGPIGAKARDLIHAAVMRNNGLQTIISADTHFDMIDGLTRIDPRRFVSEQAP